MADPICRWRNSSIKQVIEFSLLFPFESMKKGRARIIVENRWGLIGGKDFFTTPYQLAAQMGMYYEDDTNLYPRFASPLTFEEASEYLLYWGKHYYAPNPYTKSMDYTQKPVIINNFLVNWVLEHESASWSEALNNMFTDSVGNTDILVNMINNFTEVYIKDDIITLKDPATTKYDIVRLDYDPYDKKTFFEYIGYPTAACISAPNTSNNPEWPLQQIFYGAPGTGKSHKVDKECAKFSHHRTTFHPDSDYSTFVGCYKPTKVNAEKIYNTGELISLLSKIKSTGTSYPCQKWASRYWESIKELSTDVVKNILNSCGFTDSMTTEVSKSIAVGEEFAANSKTSQITYAFTPQAFTIAYIEAWQKFKANEKVYLVIEEINRGNCAQIFGDLFQLLDRNEDGYSTYPIEPDTDLGTYISKQGLNVQNAILKKKDGTTEDISGDINQGKKLVLPPNLYIWATMNTSDQSLFPIDSAFKRRWDWKYVPISPMDENYKIVAFMKDEKDEKMYKYSFDWWKFLEKVNEAIDAATSSEDKKLGYFFCKGDKQKEISANKFVSKVLFYLWTDVFKDYDADEVKFTHDGKDYELLKYKLNESDTERTQKFTFPKFFDTKGDANEEMVVKFLTNIEVVFDKTEVKDGKDAAIPPKSNHRYIESVIYEGTVYDFTKNKKQQYIELLQEIGFERVEPILNRMPLKYHRSGEALVMKSVPVNINNYTQVGDYYINADIIDDTKIPVFELLKEELNLDLTINLKS